MWLSAPRPYGVEYGSAGRGLGRTAQVTLKQWKGDKHSLGDISERYLRKKEGRSMDKNVVVVILLLFGINSF